MKASELVELLEPFGDLEVNVIVDKACHPIQTVFKDDAPFCNLNCVFIVADMSQEIKRPALLGF